MSNLSVVDKALRRYVELHSNPKAKLVQPHGRAWRKLQDAQQLFYEPALRFAHAHGFDVATMSEQERERKFVVADGSTVKAQGWFARPHTIRLRTDSLATLVHELGHGLTYQRGLRLPSAEDECVAIGVQYLVMSDLAGYHAAQPNLWYAQAQHVTRELVKEHADLIRDISVQMISDIRPRR